MRNGFTLGENIGPADCPIMRRWVFNTPVGSLRLHHFLRDDVDRESHDHPWWFVTLVLSGSYTDVHWDGRRDELHRGSFRFRSALHRHRVETPGCWTLVLTGRVVREWGFWDRWGFVRKSVYLRTRKSAACDD